MLVWMRNSAFAGAFKFLLMGLLLMAVGGMIFMDRGGFFSGAMTDNTIVKGGGVNISAQEFDRSVRRTLSRQGMGAEEAYKLGMINQILMAEIQNRLFTQKSNELGLKVADEDVTHQIARMAEPLATDGRTKKQALQQILRSQGISESEFIGTIRTEMGNTLLREALQPPATLSSPLMAQDLYRYDNEKRTAKIIVLKNADVKGATPPNEEQLQKYYESNKSDFLIPETRTVTMATLKSDMLKKNIKITDDQLKEEYQKNLASFTKPSRRVVEQAVLKTEDEAKKAADAVKSGKALKDSVPKDAYNGQQDFEEAGLLPEIATPVFASKKGAVLGPIKTDLGYHVLIVKDILPEFVASFDDMKDSLRTELENIDMTDEMYQTGNTIEDRIAAGDKLEDLVNEYGMTTEVIGPFRQNGKDASGKDLFKSYAADAPKLVQAAYDYNKGEIAPSVETADGQFHIIRIDTVVPDAYRAYKSVKDELSKRWIGEQQKLANQARAKTALEALNSGKSIDAVAKQDGVTVQTMANINRKSEPAAPLTPVATAQIFTTDKGKNFSSGIPEGFIIGQVEDMSMPDATTNADPKELKDLQDLTGTSLSTDILGQFVANLSRGNKVKINQQRIDQLYAKPQDQQIQ